MPCAAVRKQLITSSEADGGGVTGLEHHDKGLKSGFQFLSWLTGFAQLSNNRACLGGTARGGGRPQTKSSSFQF